jgi:chitodextrinase
VLDVNNLDEVTPIFTSSSYANPMDENSGAGQVIYTAVADDSADISDGVSFTLHGESTIFTIDEANGEVTLTDMPDYEYQAEYIFAVIATDTVNTPVIKHVSLTINNIDDTAPIITSTSTIAIDEASGYEQIVYIATADDSADVSDGVTFSLVSGSDPALTIDVMTGEVVLYNNPDYESQSEYNFTVVATDVAGNSSEQTIVLGVNNLDESAPTITSTAIASAINENSGSGQIVYTATADDSNDISGGVIFNLAEGSDSALTIDAMTGEVVLNNNPDYESQSEYNFTVVATDAAGNVSSPHSVTLSINNLDDAPPIIIPVDPICIDENSGAGQVVYIAAANDSGDISDGVTFSLGHENAELFSIQASTGEVTLLVNPVSGLDYNFTLFATDASGNISPPHSITLCINAIDDPIADLGTQNISVTNSPKGILGRTSVLEVAYDTTDNNSQLSGLGMRVHFDSSLLSFKEITGLIEQDIIIDGLGPYNDEADSDNDPLTDQYIMFGWASLLNNWPNVELPTVLMNIAFDVSNTIDTDAISSTSINFTDSAFTAGYGFNAENYELGLLKATWDLDGNGEADALTDGLMMLRYLFGLRGDAVTNTAIAINSLLSQTEVIAEIEASLDIADIDADGKLNALTDGLLLLRYLFAMRDDSLTYGAIGPYANRTSNEQIEHYIESFLPAM